MIVKVIQDIIDFLAAFNWPLILAYICSGPFISALWQIIKKNRQLEKWGVIQSVGATLSFVHTGILVLLTDPGALNMLPVYGPAMYGYTQAWYPAIKKADNWISTFLADMNAKNTQATAAMS